MIGVSKDKVMNDILDIVIDLTSDWEYEEEITNDTKLFYDLRFESVDAVALGTALEQYCGHPLPFVEFLTKLGENGIRELSVGQLGEFVYTNLNNTQSGEQQS